VARPPEWWGLYDEKEVQVLLAHYAEWQYLRHRPFFHVRLMDLEAAMSRLPRKLAEVMLVYGLHRLDARSAGEVLRISHTAVTKRYRQGLEEIMFHINGSDY
jgi:DNA-directed RNA polymerase specialized sigma24 family protein